MQLDFINRNKIVSLKQAADLRGCSVDTLRRTAADKLIRVGARRLGMRVGDALMLPRDGA